MEGQSPEQEGENEAQQSADQALPDRKLIPPAEPPKGENATQPTGDEPKKRKRCDKRWFAPQVIVNSALAMITIGIGMIYYFQLQQMKRQLLIDQRAWVATNGVVGTPEGGKILVTQVNMINSGRTFAKNINVAGALRAYLRGVIPDFENEMRGAAHDRKPQDISQGIIAPNGQTSSTTHPPENAEALTEPDVEALKKGYAKYFFFGQITYDDIFGKSHWLTFCFKLNYRADRPENGGWSWDCYEKYNDTGDGAPPWKY